MAITCTDWESTGCGNKICCYECESRQGCNIACGKINDITKEDAETGICENAVHK